MFSSPETVKAVAAALLFLLGLGGTGSQADLEDGKLTPRLQEAIADLPRTASIDVIVETEGSAADAADAARRLGIDVVWEYSIIDAFSARVRVDELHTLADQAWVVRVWDSVPVTTLMDVSTRDIEADDAWAAGYTGAGVTVAVLDTGIDLLDPAFSGAIASCVSTIAGLVLPECNDTDGHGTHVAGTVAARHDTFGGVAPEAQLAVVRVLHAAGAGTSADVIAGMDWVARNKDDVVPPIQVATMSVGSANPGCDDGTSPEGQAADALVAAGVGFTVAAGNSGHEECTVDGAAAAFDVITVGAVDDRNTPDPFDDVLAEFSSAGPTTDGRIKPEVVAPGVNIRGVFVGPLIAELSGTSMATPHAAGVLALLLDKEPGLPPAEAKARLVNSTVRPDAAPTLPDEDWGYGLINACLTLRLAGCTGTPAFSPPEAGSTGHVGSVTLTVRHTDDVTHRVYAHVIVVNETGEGMGDVNVSLNVTSPEGTVYERGATTDDSGRTRVQVTQGEGGHGTWEACVTRLAVAYDASANRQTCDRLAVT